MSPFHRVRALHLQCAAAAACLMLCAPSQAVSLTVDGTTIATVSVNGGADTANPGTTCIRVTTTISATCTAGFVAIPNNNKLLIAAALVNKTSGSKVMLYYEDAAASNHCPGYAFTPCTVISIESK
jgi:hypothetical protein